MKKRIYKLVSVAVIAVAMVVSVQMSNTNNISSDISIMAMAEKVKPIGMYCYNGHTPIYNFYVDCGSCELNLGDGSGGDTCFQ